MKVCLRALCIPLLVAVIGCALFCCVSVIPQSMLWENASVSAEQMAQMPGWEITIIPDQTYQMDNFTDMMIVMESYNLTHHSLKSVLLNPFRESASDNGMNAFNELVNWDEPNTANYVRYWMGFRILIRPMLMIASYSTIRKIVSVAFFVLLAAAIAVISRKAGTIAAICFGCTIALVNPGIVAHSLQFSCDFILTFLFCIYICLFGYKHLRLEYLFCLFGVLTQFFDFYTSPIMTWGFPILLSCLLECERPNELYPVYVNRTSRHLHMVAKSIVFWLLGYGGMWITKLALVTLVTDVNGFTDGFSSFAGRVGITVREDLREYHDVAGAVGGVWRTTFPGLFGKAVNLSLAVAIPVTICILLHLYRKKAVFYCLGYAMVIAIPLVWFCIAAQPTNIHMMFQYRSISVVLFAILLFLCQPAADFVKYLQRKSVQRKLP